MESKADIFCSLLVTTAVLTHFYHYWNCVAPICLAVILLSAIEKQEIMYNNSFHFRHSSWGTYILILTCVMLVFLKDMTQSFSCLCVAWITMIQCFKFSKSLILFASFLVFFVGIYFCEFCKLTISIHFFNKLVVSFFCISFITRLYKNSFTFGECILISLFPIFCSESHIISLFLLFVLSIEYCLITNQILFIPFFLIFELIIIVLYLLYLKVDLIIELTEIVNLCLQLDSIKLILFWSCMVFLAVSVVIFNSSLKISTFYIRKIFHFCIVCVYTSGIIYNLHLLFIASVGVLFVFLIVDAFRRHAIFSAGKLLQIYLEPFIDSRDAGDVLVTPLFLLIGCSFPIWLHFCIKNRLVVHPLLVWSGVITVGVGDTVAALIGKRFGKTKWIGSHRTLEGSMASLLSQVFCCALIISPENVMTNFSILCAIITNVIVEAYTYQIDNLVLPLIFYALIW